jgi:phytoene dehydrogenase-like protein
VIGGMGAISKAIARSAESAGAEIMTGADVASIDVRNGSVIGVTLADGTELRAPVVASGTHPKTTVLDLAGAENFPTEVAEDMRRYRTRGASVKVNMVLSEPPVYEGVTDEEQQLMRTAGVNICPSIDYVEAELPSAVDTTLTDDGRWVMTMFTQYGPPNEEDWKPGDRERYGETCIEQLTQFAPNLKDSVLEYEVLAPPDLERIFGLQGGSIFQGEQGLDQMAFMRPHPEMAQYATPVDGLYLCGAGTHPGGGVTGCSGHNAAHRILKDRKRARRPWRRAKASA